MTHRRHDRRSPSPLLIAVLISVLFHQLFLNLAEYLRTFQEEPEEKRFEVTLAPTEPPEPAPEPPAPQPEPQAAEPQKKRARRAPVPTPQLPAPAPEVSPDPAEPQELAAETAAPPPTPQPKLNLKLGWRGFDTVFGETAQEERERFAARSRERRTRTGTFGGMTGKVKTALHRNSGWVKNNNQEILGKRSRVFKTYLEIVHDKIHVRFADGFLGSLAAYSPDDPINNHSLMAKLEFEILPNGQISEVRLIKTSGNTLFDAAAVDSLYRTSPHVPPPKAVMSWNGRVYMRWGFYRNQRKCGVFNAEPYIISAPGGPQQDLDPDTFKINGS